MKQETWRIKKLDVATPREFRTIPKIKREWGGAQNDYPTIGYSAAVQSPDEVIHLMTSMNHPSLHIALNEAWILSDREGEQNTGKEGGTERPLERTDCFPDGKRQATWSGLIVANGEYFLHGPETWYFHDGRKQYQVVWDKGRKTGTETYWDSDGKITWQWKHEPDGTSVWTRFGPRGEKRAESRWRNFKAEGEALRWDAAGEVISRVLFKEGAIPD